MWWFLEGKCLAFLPGTPEVEQKSSVWMVSGMQQGSGESTWPSGRSFRQWLSNLPIFNKRLLLKLPTYQEVCHSWILLCLHIWQETSTLKIISNCPFLFPERFHCLGRLSNSGQTNWLQAFSLDEEHTFPRKVKSNSFIFCDAFFALPYTYDSSSWICHLLLFLSLWMTAFLGQSFVGFC